MWQTGNLILNSIVYLNGFFLWIWRILRGDLCDVMTGHHGAIHARGMYVKKNAIFNLQFYQKAVVHCFHTL